jgi:hypothetical protein
VLGFLAVEACAESSPPPDAKSVHVINLEPYFRELRSVTVTVLGEPRRFLFDTGGGQTIISPALAEEVGCDPYGRSVGFRMSGERVDFETCAEVRLRIGDYATGPQPVAVWDVGAVLPEELPPLDGVISLKSFDDELVTLDLAQSQITVETDQSFQSRTATMSPVPIQVSTGQSGSGIVVYVGADADGQRLWLQFDTGNIAGVQLSPDVVELFGVNLSEEQEGVLEGQGAVTVDSLPLTISGLGSIPVPAVIRPLIIDGALSFDLIERWVFSLDLRSDRLWAGSRD